MFKITTPRPAPTPAYLLVAEQNARAEEGDMDLDTNETDPSMTSNAEARVAIPGETIANAQEWMRCAAERKQLESQRLDFLPAVSDDFGPTLLPTSLAEATAPTCLEAPS